MYCLFDPNGKPNFSFIAYSRKTVEDKWLDVWIPDLRNWRKWYRQGYRIRKVKVSVEIKQ